MTPAVLSSTFGYSGHVTLMPASLTFTSLACTFRWTRRKGSVSLNCQFRGINHFRQAIVLLSSLKDRVYPRREGKGRCLHLPATALCSGLQRCSAGRKQSGWLFLKWIIPGVSEVLTEGSVNWGRLYQAPCQYFPDYPSYHGEQWVKSTAESQILYHRCRVKVSIKWKIRTFGF